MSITIDSCSMGNTIIDTNFNFPGQQSLYKGKVREVYHLDNNILVMVATDRLSAFDVVMPKGIPYKGQILNQIATKMMADTADIVPNWLMATPDPNVAVGFACEPFKVEMGDHDEDISREAILERGIVSEEDYLVLEKYTKALFQRGTEIAAKRGLILVDTKYEFGKTKDGKIVLIDEIHTPDSSRYFYAEGYAENQKKRSYSKTTFKGICQTMAYR